MAASMTQASDSKRTLAFGHFRKTKLCSFFQAQGRCKFGEACNFAHCQEEIQERVSLSKTSLCKNFMKGCCPLSARDCCFAHGKRELRRVMPAAEAKTEAKSPLKEVAAVALKEERSLSETSTCSSLPACSWESEEESGSSVDSWSDFGGDEASPVSAAPAATLPAAVGVQEAAPGQAIKTTSAPMVGQVLVPAFVWQGKVYMGNIEEVLMRAQPDHYED